MANKGGYKQDKPNWFNASKYSGFEWLSGQSHKSTMQLWSKALRLRQRLAGFSPDLKAECIEKLILNPLDDCGLGSLDFISHKEVLWNSSNNVVHPYGQPTVSPTRCGQLPDNLTDSSRQDPALCLDDIYLTDCPQLHPYAFLTINLAGSDSLIKKDFNNWLLAIRAHRNWPRPFTSSPESLIEKWSDYKLMQCIDLVKIIGPAKGEKISMFKAVEWAEVSAERLSETFTLTTLPTAMKQALDLKTSNYLV
ncbi:MAG: hypothetical protein ABIP37_05970 [Methylotenera sp.]